MIKNKKNILILGLILLLIIAIIGVSYAAFSETSGWYNDYRTMVSEEYPWLVLGGVFDNGTFAGVFSFSFTGGGAYSGGSFRLVMSPSL